MIKQLLIHQKSDILGTAASALCLVHCVVTPFLFATHASFLEDHHGHPIWWGFLDILFITFSMFAVYWSSKTTSKTVVRYAFWLSWMFLLVVILNEKLKLFPLSEDIIYMPSLALIGLHIYNRKYCKCKNDTCCVSE